MAKIIDYGAEAEADFDPTSFAPPVPSTSAVGEVKRVFTYTGELSISKIEKLTGNKIGNFNLLATDEDKYVQIDI